MDQKDRKYASEVISIQHCYGNHGNTIDGNHVVGPIQMKTLKSLRSTE